MGLFFIGDARGDNNVADADLMFTSKIRRNQIVKRNFGISHSLLRLGRKKRMKQHYL